MNLRRESRLHIDEMTEQLGSEAVQLLSSCQGCDRGREILSRRKSGDVATDRLQLLEQEVMSHNSIVYWK